MPLLVSERRYIKYRNYTKIPALHIWNDQHYITTLESINRCQMWYVSLNWTRQWNVKYITQ